MQVHLAQRPAAQNWAIVLLGRGYSVGERGRYMKTKGTDKYGSADSWKGEKEKGNGKSGEAMGLSGNGKRK